MADNVAITAGAGTDIATDDSGTGHVQIVKLALSADGSKTPITADAKGIQVQQATATDLKSQVSVASGGVASGAIATGAIVDALADDAGFTPATSRVFPAGFLGDDVSPDVVDEGDVGAGRMTLDRKVIVNPQPYTLGGLLVKDCTSQDGSTALAATKQTIKANPGQLYGWYVYNPNSSAQWVHFYNTDTVTVGTTSPLLSIVLPPLSAANLLSTMGIAFSAAISTAATTDGGGNTAPAVALEAVFFYA